MPNTREKLIELICYTKYGNGSLIGKNFQKGFIEKIADHLIANGVTIQEECHWATEQAFKNGYEKGKQDAVKWIPVKDRLPTEEDAPVNGYVYAFTKAKKVLILRYQYVCQFAKYMHCWMPISLPQPPKGE